MTSMAARVMRGERGECERLGRSILPIRNDNWVERPWAGHRLAAFKGGAARSGVGESFELASARFDPEAARFPSHVVLPDGSELALPALLDRGARDILGDDFLACYGRSIPVLPKFLDVGSLLSVQAHPVGFAELYVVIDCDPGASMRVGFSQAQDRDSLRAMWSRGRALQQRVYDSSTVTPPQLQSRFASYFGDRDAGLPDELAFAREHAGELKDIYWRTLDALNVINCRPGQVIWNASSRTDDIGRPSALIHALGNPERRGLLALEIRRPGPTLRAWDNVRFPMRPVDIDGALANVDLTAVDAGGLEIAVDRNEVVSPLIRCPSFHVDRVCVAAGAASRTPHADLFRTLHVTRGVLTVATDDCEYDLRAGQSALIPPALASVELRAQQAAECICVALPTDAKPRQVQVPLAFGTSGLRGLVRDMRDCEVYVNTVGFLDFLASSEMGAPAKVAIAYDLRARDPDTGLSSSPRIAAAVTKAIADTGATVINCGEVPTPALASYGIAHNMPSVMITGSHIPANRNGIKFYTATGEVLKSHESEILAAVDRRRDAVPDKLFDAEGMFIDLQALPEAMGDGRADYITRYREAFCGRPLDGMRLVVHEHSSVCRDVLRELLIALGASVQAVDRSTDFVPVDTEVIPLATTQRYQAWIDEFSADALLSTDGDGDRPVFVDSAGTLVPGDILGLATADFLDADCVVMPVTVTDAVELWARVKGVDVRRTRVGSPYVIDGMLAARRSGFRRVIGWEANGGVLLGDDIRVPGGSTLPALSTRDAVLPIAVMLVAARQSGCTVAELVSRFPARATASSLIDNVERDKSLAIVSDIASAASNASARQVLGHELANLGAGEVARIDATDGARVAFTNGEAVHVRPSGNAPQLRVYASADSRDRAQALVDEMLKDGGPIRAWLQRLAD